MSSRLLESTPTKPINRRQPRAVRISPAYLLGLAIFLIPILNNHPAYGQSTRVLRIYLARHGQTDWNFERRIQGNTDTALNATGLKQAAHLAERLKGVDLDRVYSSTLRRSRDTAEIARGEAPLKNLAGLNERRVGKFEGKWLDRTKDPATVQEYPKRSRDPMMSLMEESRAINSTRGCEPLSPTSATATAREQSSLSGMPGRIK